VKVLVTGGAGFVGSHVVEALVEAGAEVRVLDLVDRQLPDARRTTVEFLRGDVRDASVCAAAVEGVDSVCHQAAKVGLGVDFGDTGSYVDHNDAGTAALLEALWRRRFAGRFVLASSMVVYGAGRSQCPEHGVVAPGPRRVEDLRAERFDSRCPIAGCGESLSWTPVDEDAPADPQNVYAATKLHQEHLCTALGRETGANVVALRYHNVYGPRMPRDTPYAGVASIFRSSLLAGRSPEVFEDGRQTRDFVHVRDVARANVLALTADDVDAGAYNVASGAPRTIGELANALAAVVGSTLAPQVTGGWRLGDVRHVVASPRRAADRLGFVADVSFEAGMAEFALASSTTAPAGR
jgi:dTDP-L-rhamnose 4-epimerase